MIRLLVCWEVPTANGHLGGHIYVSVDALTEAALEQVCADLHAKLAAGNTLAGHVELRSVLPLAEAETHARYGALEGEPGPNQRLRVTNGTRANMPDGTAWVYELDAWRRIPTLP